MKNLRTISVMTLAVALITANVYANKFGDVSKPTDSDSSDPSKISGSSSGKGIEAIKGVNGNLGSSTSVKSTTGSSAMKTSSAISGSSKSSTGIGSAAAHATPQVKVNFSNKQNDIAPSTTATKSTDSSTTTSSASTRPTSDAKTPANVEADRVVNNEFKSPAAPKASDVEGGQKALDVLKTDMKADLAELIQKVGGNNKASVEKGFDEMIESIMTEVGKGKFRTPDGKLDTKQIENFLKRALELAAASKNPAAHMKEDIQHVLKDSPEQFKGYQVALEIFGKAHDEFYQKTYDAKLKELAGNSKLSQAEKVAAAHEAAVKFVDNIAGTKIDEQIVKNGGAPKSNLYGACVKRAA